jgi:hypothetical protein
MTMRRVFCTILLAVGYLASMEAQEAPIHGEKGLYSFTPS